MLLLGVTHHRVICSDHRLNDFPGWDYPDWVFKSEHTRRYRELGAGKTRVIAVYPGFFLEILINPFRKPYSPPV